jgi:hypothetical protein
MKDLRQPIGLFFAIAGVVLEANPWAHAQLTDIPVNLWAGSTMLIFGGAMLWMARRRS